MIKKINLILLIFLALPLISAVTLTNVNISTTGENYSISVDSMETDKIVIKNDTISFFNFTSEGSNFININDTYNATINFYNLSTNLSVYNVYWDVYLFNSTDDLQNYNATFNSTHTIRIVNLTSLGVITLTLFIYHPTNRTYDSSEITLNVSAENGSAITYIYSLDSGENISFTPNTTLNNLGWEAYHEIRVWVNDTSGNVETATKRFYLGEVSWTTALIVGLIGLISIYALAGFYIFSKEHWMIKSYLYFSALGMLLVLMNSARILAVGSDSTTIITVGYTIAIVSLLVMFLYLFVFFFIETIKSLKEKKGVRWNY